MTNDQPSNPGTSAPKRRAPNATARTRSGKTLRVEATRRKQVDPDMIALCYWLIAQRIVQDARDDEAAEQVRPATAGDDVAAGDRVTRSHS